MPDVSMKQRQFMGAVKHDPAFAKKVGVPQSVGADFIAADQAAGMPKLPERVKSKLHRAVRRQAIQAGKIHPRSHSEFEHLGS